MFRAVIVVTIKSLAYSGHRCHLENNSDALWVDRLLSGSYSFEHDRIASYGQCYNCPSFRPEQQSGKMKANKRSSALTRHFTVCG